MNFERGSNSSAVPSGGEWGQEVKGSSGGGNRCESTRWRRKETKKKNEVEGIVMEDVGSVGRKRWRNEVVVGKGDMLC